MCLPHAGGAADAYATWARDLDGAFDVWSVNLPGRRHRAGEPFATSMAEIVDDLVTDLVADGDDRPLVLFGHSMGGLVAFELAAALEPFGSVVSVVISAARAPDRTPAVPSSYGPAERARRLLACGGTPTALLRDREFLNVTLATLAADLAVCDAYRPAQPPVIAAPLVALAALDDTVCPVREVLGWRDRSARFGGIHYFRGGHFFLTACRRQVLQVVRAAGTRCASWAAGSSPLVGLPDVILRHHLAGSTEQAQADIG